jgi:hypothetical protein
LQFLQILATHLNLTIEATEYQQGVSFETILDQMYNETFDIFSATFENSSIFDVHKFELSLPIYSVSSSFICYHFIASNFTRF